ncbi:zinc-dependent metalloprotease [Prevotella sp. E13-17]|nr:zinc-dependent metalloprotease [Prevotella sp. E13-17]UKK51639.1 zinc-dependent metalloprotease [Prevotella sp. E13-17]
MNKTLTTIIAMMMACNMQASPVMVAKTDTLQNDSVEVDTLKTKNKSQKHTTKKEEKKETEYEKLIKKGGTVTNGLFGMRHIDDKYYFEVPDSILGRYLLFVTRLTAVPQNFGLFAGEEVSHSTVYFERRDTTRLMMRQYVLSHVADDKDNIARTLEQSTVDPIVRSFKIIGRNKEEDNSLIEVTSFLTGDSHLTSFASGNKGTLKVGGQNKDLTFIDTIKVFPTNIEVASTRTYGSSAGRSEASKTGAMTMAFNTSIVLLPKEPMRKRLWDERVGYFVNNYVRFSDQQHKTQHESFISRYRLVPKNKKKYLRGELTEPEKQIVYYIDPATPKKWIPYLIQGIKDWNVAFEAAGFKNAITAKVLPENDPNISLEDARYSVLRYLPSETENAYGPRIVDPRSGEIIEAHICWYHNVMNLLTKWYMTQCGAVDKRAQTMHFDDKLMGELIRFVSSHEVGHSLGLRHNMGASFATPVEKLRDKAWVEANGHTASIMDYARFNYVAQPEDKISEKGLFPRINDYDKWAIKWGYQWRPEFKDEYEEKEQLMTETTRTLKGNPRLWFGGEGRNEDARAQTEDLGDNSVKASEYGIKNLKRIMQKLPEWTHQDNDQYDDLSEMYNAVRDQFNRYVNHVAKNIGSRYTNNMPGRTPVEYASPERQKQAVAFIGQQVFEMPEWLYPTAIVSKTATDVANTHQQMQSNLLNRMMTPLMFNNIAATDYAVDAYLEDLKTAVWKPIGKANDQKAKARRQLQRSYVQHLNSILNPTETDMKGVMGRYMNSDASLYVLMNLAEVEKFCQQQLQESSGLNALHYEDMLRQLKLIRERRTTVK